MTDTSARHGEAAVVNSVQPPAPPVEPGPDLPESTVAPVVAPTEPTEPTEPPSTSTSPAGRWQWRGLLLAVGLFVGLRLWLSGVAAATLWWLPPEWTNLTDDLHRGFTPMREGVEALLLGVWVRWDANWYLEIARDGYAAGNGTVVYPPLFPGLIWLVGQLLGSELRGAMLVASLAALVVFPLFYRLARLDLGEAASRRALLWFALFPASFFLFAPYTEPVFIALAVGALLAARSQHWTWAISLAALAALTRVPGIWLAPVLAVEMLHPVAQRAWRERRVEWPAVAELARRGVWLAAIPAALGAFAIYARYVVGDELLWRHLDTYWRLHWAPPWVGLLGDLNYLLNPPVLVPPDPVPWINEGTNRLGILVDLLVGIGFVGLAIVALFRLRPSYSLYIWLMLLSGMTKVDEFDLTQSLTRYALVVFPAFFLLGAINLPPLLARALAVVGVILLTLFTAAYAHWWWLW